MVTFAPVHQEQKAAINPGQLVIQPRFTAVYCQWTSPLSLVVLQQCFSKWRSWSPWGLWKWSKCGLEGAGEVVLITSSPSSGSTRFCFDCSVIASSLSVLLDVSSSPAHHHQQDRAADLADEMLMMPSKHVIGHSQSCFQTRFTMQTPKAKVSVCFHAGCKTG